MGLFVSTLNQILWLNLENFQWEYLDCFSSPYISLSKNEKWIAAFGSSLMVVDNSGVIQMTNFEDIQKQG